MGPSGHAFGCENSLPRARLSFSFVWFRQSDNKFDLESNLVILMFSIYASLIQLPKQPLFFCFLSCYLQKN